MKPTQESRVEARKRLSLDPCNMSKSDIGKVEALACILDEDIENEYKQKRLDEEQKEKDRKAALRACVYFDTYSPFKNPPLCRNEDGRGCPACEDTWKEHLDKNNMYLPTDT